MSSSWHMSLMAVFGLFLYLLKVTEAAYRFWLSPGQFSTQSGSTPFELCSIAFQNIYSKKSPIQQQELREYVRPLNQQANHNDGILQVFGDWLQTHHSYKQRKRVFIKGPIRLRDSCVFSVLKSANALNSNKYNNKMEQIKSPKSVAYARLGKPQSGKLSVAEQHKKGKRNSTGNFYQQILEQIPSETTSYIRSLVNKNDRQIEYPKDDESVHFRRKSNAEYMIESSSLERQRKDNPRQERETLCKGKYAADNAFLQQQITPKNGSIPLKKWTSASKNPFDASQTKKIMINSFKNQSEHGQQSFLSNLTNYLEELAQMPENNKARYQGIEKLSETVKINSGQSDYFKIVAKLEQSHMKIKELKLKNYYQDKEISKCKKKQMKMKESLFEMLGQIKQLTAQLSYEKKERKKLEKIVDNFQMRKPQFERKTIGKSYLRLQQLQSDMNTQNDYDRDCQSSFQEYLNNTMGSRKNYNNLKRIFDDERYPMHGILNSQKIQKLFRSNQNSDQSDE